MNELNNRQVNTLKRYIEISHKQVLSYLTKYYEKFFYKKIEVTDFTKGVKLEQYAKCVKVHEPSGLFTFVRSKNGVYVEYLAKKSTVKKIRPGQVYFGDAVKHFKRYYYWMGKRSLIKHIFYVILSGTKKDRFSGFVWTVAQFTRLKERNKNIIIPGGSICIMSDAEVKALKYHGTINKLFKK